MKYKPIEIAILLTAILIVAFYLAPVLQEFIPVAVKTGEAIKAINVFA